MRALAARLTPFVREECVIAIVLPRVGSGVYVAQLAVMSAGAAYTCLEPGFADERLAAVLDDAKPVAVIATASLADRLASLGVPRERIVTLDPHAPGTNGHAFEAPAHLTPHHLAYVIYTSGTSGRPKGVMVEHRNILTLVLSDVRYFGLGPGDRCAQSSSCAYDSSVEETWLAFACGATLVPMDDDVVRLGPDLVPWLREQHVTVFCPPPTLLRMTGCDDPARELPGLKLLYVGGEELPSDVAARWAPGRRLENGYGPTECSVTVVRTPVRAGEPVTIGVPVEGNHAWVLDESLDELPDGIAGELCIGGPSVTRGYLGSPELTAERFVEHPRFGRLYRTGDLARRNAAGMLEYLGRTDSQVKIRGHRVELTAIEARLSEMSGVVAAACKVQGEPSARELAAFLVSDGGRPLDLDAVREHVRHRLPEHMRPVHFAVVESLPTRDSSGKLDRSALPDLVASRAPRNGHARTAKLDPLAQLVADAFAAHVPERGHIGADDDFFLDLGGNSLVAAQVISTLRRDTRTASLTVRDLYETRTVAALAALARSQAPREPNAGAAPAVPPLVRTPARDTAVALVQLAWIAAGVIAGSAVAYAAVFLVLPALERAWGARTLLFALPWLAFAAELAWLPVAFAIALVAKRVLVGTYRPGRYDASGAFHLRHWLVTQAARGVPWHLVEGTEAKLALLRLLGARIGRNVHVARGVDLAAGGWDLVTLADGATLGRDAALGHVAYAERQLVLTPVTIGPGATLDTRAHVAGGASLGANATLGALAMLPEGAHVPTGERWDGVPARPAGRSSEAPPVPRAWPAALHAAATIATRGALGFARALPALVLASLLFSPGAPRTGLLPAPFGALPIALAPLVLVLGYLVSLPVEAFACRALGRVRAGAHALHSWTGVAIAMKDELVEAANGALSGTLLWPVWLRAAGARVGARCEISTVMEVVPELLTIGDECFFADGIYLGRPWRHRGTITCAPTALSTNTFFGNHAVIPAGASLPPGILLGICTVADPARVTPGSSWFGQPAFELPKREVIASERSLTHAPSWERRLTRVVFEWARFVMPLVPLALAWAWFARVPAWRATQDDLRFFLLTLPLAAAAVGAVLLAATLAVKWLVMGPIRAGQHVLWSCWCCRWDILFEAWAGWAVPVLAAFEGTPFVAMWLRAMGCRVGHGVVFGSSFLQVVDPEMLVIEDGATVSCHLQSHSFEDRVLKLAPVRIGAGATVGKGAVLLYGADIGDGATVAESSVVMKHEALTAGGHYVGCPTREAAAECTSESEAIA